MPGYISIDEITWLRANSPAWRLLRAENAPLVLSFLHRVFVQGNARAISAADLEALRLPRRLGPPGGRLAAQVLPGRHR